MALSDKEFRRLYAGNVLWYQRFAESSRPSFLQRNINAVLRSHERQSARVADEGRPPVKPASVPVSAAGSEPNGQMKRGSLINSIADRLTPYDFGFTQSRQVLRIDVKSLKRKRDESGPTRDYAEEVGGNGSISSRNRCKCEITIWHAPRSTSGPRNRQLQLLRDSQMCTVLSVRRSNEDSHAIVELDQPFLIGLSKLLVPTSRGKVEKLALAESYRTQISLQPFFSPGKGWPPFSVRSGRTETAQAPCSEASRLPSHVVAKLDGSLKLLSGERMLQVKLDVAQGQPKIDTDFVLHVEALWSKPRSSLPISGLKVQRPPLAFSSGARPRGSAKVQVRYVFQPLGTITEGNNLRAYIVPGYRCSFCPGRAFPTGQILKFHLVNHHELFRFHFVEKPLGSQLVIQVDINSDYVASGGRGDDDEDQWSWCRPTSRTFNVAEYLKGDASWVNGRFPRPSRRATARHPAQRPSAVTHAHGPRKAPRLCHPVPSHPSGRSFYRNSTKRASKEGELLSDSDGEPDEAWLRQKHAETIDDFSDVSGPEKEFIKAFDEFMFEEHVPANRFLPEVLHAFTRRNSAWLRRSDMSIEFLKHGTKLVQYGMLDPRILHDCASMIRQQGMDDEEMGDAEGGGLPHRGRSDAPPRAGVAKVEDMSVDGADTQQGGHARRYPVSNPALCICGEAWSVGSESICQGRDCPHRVYHLSCVGLTRRASGWLCPACTET